MIGGLVINSVLLGIGIFGIYEIIDAFDDKKQKREEAMERFWNLVEESKGQK